jgi:hypothetical protein
MIALAFIDLPHQGQAIADYLLALKYSLRWNSRDLSYGVVSLAAFTVTYFLAKPG